MFHIFRNCLSILAILAMPTCVPGCASTAKRGDNASAQISKAEQAQAETKVAAAAKKPAQKDISFEIAFVTHLDKNLPEQDVYIERVKGSGEVFRVTPGDNDMSAPLYKVAVETEHDPFNEDAVGPHEKGEAMGFTLGEWLKHRGTGTYTYKNGKGHLKLAFSGLVPGGVYTMWHAFTAFPPTDRFQGTLDLPLGARDGTESVFTADANGTAEFEHTFRPGLQLSESWTTSMLAINYHSDGKTYGGRPGAFGTVAHIPLFVMLPKREGVE